MTRSRIKFYLSRYKVLLLLVAQKFPAGLGYLKRFRRNIFFILSLFIFKIMYKMKVNKSKSEKGRSPKKKKKNQLS